ncbi:MAG: hypothetical protein KDK07_26740 [Bauldia sp.]|nr:hypothetical protein [Bauldia sp.]
MLQRRNAKDVVIAIDPAFREIVFARRSFLDKMMPIITRLPLPARSPQLLQRSGRLEIGGDVVPEIEQPCPDTENDVGRLDRRRVGEPTREALDDGVRVPGRGGSIGRNNGFGRWRESPAEKIDDLGIKAPRLDLLIPGDRFAGDGSL